MFSETADDRMELLALLKPFAEYAIQQEKSWTHHDASAFYGIKRPGAKQITYGDFRRAAVAYQRMTRAQPSDGPSG